MVLVLDAQAAKNADVLSAVVANTANRVSRKIKAPEYKLRLILSRILAGGPRVALGALIDSLHQGLGALFTLTVAIY
jgi:hypothetical protein